MSADHTKVKVAVVQAASVLFDREACLEKLHHLVIKGAQEGAQLLLFPEAFIPAYPRGLTFGTVIGNRSDEGRQIWHRYWSNAIDMRGPSIQTIGKTAQEAQVYLAVGVIEREGQYSRGTLYCTMLYFGPDGKLLGKHRKIKPTGAERLIWGEGDGSTLTVFDTPWGGCGGLICWENYMPMARMAIFTKGVDIYLAPTADSRDTWQATLRHIACEGRCFVLGCNQFVTKDMYPEDLPGIEEIENLPNIMCRGGSAIISPFGEVLAGPLYDREDFLLAELDLSEVVKSKFDLDVTGHYARNDIFQLSIDENPKSPVVAQT